MKRILRISNILVVWLVCSASTVGDPVASKSAAAKDSYENGNFEDAVRLYRDAQLERPNSASLNFNVGNALFKKGDIESAIDEFNQSAQRADEGLKSRSLYNMGNALYINKEYSKAAESYRQALKIDANDEDIKANLELTLRKIQEDQEQEDQEQEDQEQEDQEQQDQEQQDQEQQDQEQQDQEQEDQGQEDQGQQDQEQQDQEQQETAEEVDQMEEQDAERLLDALKDREKNAQRRRYRATGETYGKDW